MTALLVQLADAITEEINSDDWGLDFEAKRSYADWDLKLDADVGLLVDVVPARRKKLPIENRSLRDHELTVHVGIRRKFAPQSQDTFTGRIETAEVDALIALAEDIESHFDYQERLAGMPASALVSANLLGDYDRELLYENRQFVSVIELTYRCETEVSP